VYQARLNATPAVEAQMADMMRDFGNLKKQYQDLLAKKTESAWPPVWKDSNRRAVPRH